MGLPDSSTLLGAPPNKWKSNEIQQMKRVHQSYKAALVETLDDDDEARAGDLMNLAQSETFVDMVGGVSASAAAGEKGGGTGQGGPAEGGEAGENEEVATAMPSRDAEAFLPADSVLRSVNGEGKEPKNVPFKDYASFVASKDFAHWKDHFRGQSQDRFLAAIAESLVSHVCSAQAGDLRVRHGSVPLGKVLRKKREHITPLALTLHELKLWATNWLRSASIFEQATYKQIERRMRYLELLQKKEVWLNAALPLQSGMREISHDRLFRLLLTTREDLHRARDYAYRGYTRRASREKLSRLGNLLKDVLFNEMKVVSGLFSMQAKLADPKTRSLQPTDLLSSWQNQTFVNYENLANVLLSALCSVPLFRGALLSNYETEDVRSSLLDLANWQQHNLFVLPGKPDDDPEAMPTYQFDDETRNLLPEAYRTNEVRIKEELAKADPHARPPLSRKKQVKIFKKAFKSDEVITELMKRMLTVLAALQDLAPSIYICHELWTLAGQGGDFVLFDMLREQCIGVMQDTISRVHNVQLASKRLVSYYQRLVKSYEAGVERRRLLSKKANYQPAWAENFYAVKHDQLRVSRKAFSKAYMQLWELARDAWEYDLTADQLNDKIETLRQICDDFAPASRKTFKGKFKTTNLVDLTANNWLRLNRAPSSPPDAASPSVMGASTASSSSTASSAISSLRSSFSFARRSKRTSKTSREERDDDVAGGLAPDSTMSTLLAGAQVLSDDEIDIGMADEDDSEPNEDDA